MTRPRMKSVCGTYKCVGSTATGSNQPITRCQSLELPCQDGGTFQPVGCSRIHRRPRCPDVLDRAESNSGVGCPEAQAVVDQIDQPNGLVLPVRTFARHA